MKTIVKDKLTVKIFDSRAEMGKVAGEEAAAKIKELIAKKGEVNMIFAAAPSQNEVLATLVADKEIDLLHRELEQEKQKKKALMQLLLTGIVRV